MRRKERTTLGSVRWSARDSELSGMRRHTVRRNLTSGMIEKHTAACGFEDLTIFSEGGLIDVRGKKER